MKSGYKTTEFWLSLIVTVAAFLVANSSAGSAVSQVASLIVAVLAQLGYVAGRVSVKNAQNQ